MIRKFNSIILITIFNNASISPITVVIMIGIISISILVVIILITFIDWDIIVTVTNCETFHPEGFTARAGLDPLVLHEEGLDVQEVGLALQHAVSQDGPLTEVLQRYDRIILPARPIIFSQAFLLEVHLPGPSVCH